MLPIIFAAAAVFVASPQADGAASTANAQETAYVAAGCFWCSEADFEKVDGVSEAISGFTGGDTVNPSYKDVTGGGTGHYEAVKVLYDPQTVSFGDILKVFFSVAHDPTQLNRQGNDRGTQYRSAVFYENDEQKQVAEAYIRQLNSAGVYDNPLVTTLEPLEAFYPAEDYHQNFAARNPYQPYITAVAAPKIEKLVDTFGDQLKPGYTDNNIA